MHKKIYIKNFVILILFYSPLRPCIFKDPKIDFLILIIVFPKFSVKLDGFDKSANLDICSHPLNVCLLCIC